MGGQLKTGEVNIALDRATLTSALPGGRPSWHGACHILPVATLAWPPACPYRSPNLSLAKRLVAESGTAGAHVSVPGERAASASAGQRSIP